MPYFNEPNDCRGWWTSRTGLEQKLIILSTILFIIAFSLTITVIVLKGREKSGDTTTVAPPITSTSDSTTVSGDTPPPTETTVSGSPPIPPSDTPTPSPTDASTPAPTTGQSSPAPTASSPAVTEPTPVPSAITESTTKKEGSAPLEKSNLSPLMALLKEANRVNGVLEKLKEEMQAGA